MQMRKRVPALVATTLTVLLLSLGASGSAPKEVRALSTKPNIVFIITDDMRKDDLRYMPKTRSVLGDKGMSFGGALVTNALCCPSRATIMRGQYSHNTGVWTNLVDTPDGGWNAYRENGNERDNVATRLDAAGYRTALFGRYLNGYWDDTTFIPPGWDRWFATSGGYFDYDANDQGTIRHFSTTDSDYQSDVLARKTEAFIGASAAQGKPFFAYVAPRAPHLSATPAPRDLHTYDGLNARRPPSFNELSVTDKPPWIRALPRFSDAEKAAIDDRHESRIESLQAVDDLVAGVVAKLRNEGVMANTYVFFTSDNGWFEGEHRVSFGKARPYEEAVRVPLLVRGPSVGAGRHTQKLALNTDYLPTFTDLAGAQTPGYADGRSLRPVLEGTVGGWRSAVLLEARRTPEADSAPAYRGVRTNSMKYLEYADGSRELYDLRADPYELRDRHTDPAYDEVEARLASRLTSLRNCSADSCRQLEGP